MTTEAVGVGTGWQSDRRRGSCVQGQSMSLGINPNGTTSIEKRGPKLYISVTLICRCWLCCSYSLVLGRGICLSFPVSRDLGLGLGVHLSLRKGQSRVLAVLNLLAPTVRRNFAITKKPQGTQKPLCSTEDPASMRTASDLQSYHSVLTRTPLTAHVLKKQFIVLMQMGVLGKRLGDKQQN